MRKKIIFLLVILVLHSCTSNEEQAYSDIDLQATIQAGIMIALENLEPTPTPVPTSTPTSTPTATVTPTPTPTATLVPPTASPQPSISKPGKMTVARTYSGADECLAISSENAF